MTLILIISTLTLLILLFAFIHPLFIKKYDNQEEPLNSDSSEDELTLLKKQLEEHEEEYRIGKLSETDYNALSSALKRKMIGLKKS